MRLREMSHLSIPQRRTSRPCRDSTNAWHSAKQPTASTPSKLAEPARPLIAYPTSQRTLIQQVVGCPPGEAGRAGTIRKTSHPACGVGPHH